MWDEIDTLQVRGDDTAGTSRKHTPHGASPKACAGKPYAKAIPHDFAIDGKLLEVVRCSAFLPNGRALPLVPLILGAPLTLTRCATANGGPGAEDKVTTGLGANGRM